MEADRGPAGVPQLDVPEMDADHAELLALAHTLSEGLHGGMPTFWVLERLDDLLSLTLRHFDREEGLLTETAYPHLMEHVHSHNRLLRAMLQFREDVRHQRYRTELAVQFIRAWVVEHVRMEDTRYARHLHAGAAAAGGD
jgi:hemerythrin-like metal-binding protein